MPKRRAALTPSGTGVAGVVDGSPPRRLIGEESFSVSARVALQLGRESISSSVTAILELVKNAYDADAELVRVRLGKLRSKPLMIVQDNGDGMTVDTLRNQWMLIGTADKVANRQTLGKHRVKTGEKGLGRLGLDQLCTYTRVQTIVEGADKAIELKINWQHYERPEVRLERIQHRLFEIGRLDRDLLSGEYEPFPKGTRLVLMGLKDRWDVQQLEQLHRELGFLLSPFGTPEDFAIKLETGGAAASLDGVIQAPEELLEQAYWRVTATIDSSANVEITMDASNRAEVYRQPAVKWRNFIKGYGEWPRCGPLSFKIFFFRRDEKDGEARFQRAAITEFLRNNQGVRIYRDGFRVKPVRRA